MNDTHTHFGMSCANDILEICRNFNNLFLSTDKIEFGLASAVIGTHVVDWLYFKDLGRIEEGEPMKKFKNEYGENVPEYKVLLGIANGTKHPKEKYNIENSERLADWSSGLFWGAGGKEKVWVVKNNECDIILSSLIEKFCSNSTKYIAKITR